MDRLAVDQEMMNSDIPILESRVSFPSCKCRCVKASFELYFCKPYGPVKLSQAQSSSSAGQWDD